MFVPPSKQQTRAAANCSLLTAVVFSTQDGKVSLEEFMKFAENNKELVADLLI